MPSEENRFPALEQLEAEFRPLDEALPIDTPMWTGPEDDAE